LKKSLAQTIPTYVIGVFKLPDTLCYEMTRMIRCFWWGEEAGQRKVHWMAWEKLLLSKCCGGIGFWDMRLFNLALLARQAWRLIHDPASLGVQILKAKYYPNGELTDTAFPKESSTEKAIEHGLELVKKGIIWRIGAGDKVQIWRDSWIPRPTSLKLSLKKGRSRL
jgi:hypothetical protein